ncbi:NUDIX hydrolase [Shewanella cyperi]|uniref:NUDIX hydrolase n=1 Tax=Shewanella cyperi TaxID=2814292 RepID=UPI001A950B8E|nr:NUDIX hydrolase [Shewanella cyperi]QSX39385.1 NUDIX hydrolase [Shewanella cyperi]
MDRYRPNVTVACVIEAAGQFLFVEETIDGHATLNQPAGHLEAGESLLQACSREVLEETGLQLMPQGLVGIYQFSASPELAFLRFTFYCQLPAPLTGRPQDKVIKDLHWLSPAQLDNSPLALRSPLVRKCIEDYLAGKRFSLDLLDSSMLAIAAEAKAC